jgi:hypothetical protein
MVAGYLSGSLARHGAAMTSALPMDATHDRTDVPSILRAGAKLGLLQSVFIAVFAVLQVRLEGTIELVVCGVIFLIALALTIVLPGYWTRARTIEGIAGAAGIGLGATVVFLLIDVVLLQHIGTYTNRWYEIGRSNWWYHPVWWMVGTFLPWMGAWILANQLDRNGRVSVPAAFGTAVAFAVLAAIVAILVGFPGARWTLPTFGVAFLPGLALATALSAMGTRRG